MPAITSSLSLVRTAPRSPEYELREDGRPLGRVAPGPRNGPAGVAEAVVGDRT